MESDSIKKFIATAIVLASLFGLLVFGLVKQTELAGQIGVLRTDIGSLKGGMSTQAGSQSLGAANFNGQSPSGYGPAQFNDIVDLTATTTIQEIDLGTRYAKALTFTAGATTTPGGLVAIQNTGATKVCTNVQLSLSGSADITNAFAFSVATSSAAAAYSGNGANLVASSTVATSTPAVILDHVTNIGGMTQNSFYWVGGDYILGAFDAVGNQFASSTDYTSGAGTLYMTCHTQ